jgi:hypothetical protein
MACAPEAVGMLCIRLGGMNEARSRLASVEGYDPREGCWSQLTSMTVSWGATSKHLQQITP